MRILFVCTGNTCRSCMAEKIFNEMNNIESLKAFSAGISTIEGSTMSAQVVQVLSSNLNINSEGRRVVQLTQELLKESDLILTMTEYIKNTIIDSVPAYSNKVSTLNEYIGFEGDIVDPFGGDLNIYTKTYESLKRVIEILIKKIKKDKSIIE